MTRDEAAALLWLVGGILFVLIFAAARICFWLRAIHERLDRLAKQDR
jgi:hypothetical protein